MYRRSIWLFALLTVLAGCGPPLRWERPGTDPATAEADATECRAIARAQHRRLTEQPFLVPYFVRVRNNNGRVREIPVVPWRQVGPPVWAPYAPALAIDQVTLKHELYERCLEAKGYQLVPDETAQEREKTNTNAADRPEPAEQQKQDEQPQADQPEPGH
jgi:hypothetical protein